MEPSGQHCLERLRRIVMHRAVDMNSGCSHVLAVWLVVGVQVADSEKIVRARMPAGRTYVRPLVSPPHF